MELREKNTNSQGPPEKLGEVSPQFEEISIGGNRISRLGDRLIAVLLDTFLMGAAFAVIGMFVASKFKLGGVTAKGFSMEGKSAIITIGLTIIFGFLYYWILEGLLGATLGKAMIGIKIIKRDGTKCDFKSSLIRNLLRIIDIIGVYLVGFFIALFSKFRQRLGDHLANTVVIEMKIGKNLRALFVILWVAAIGGGIWFAYSIHSGIPKPTVIQPSVPAPSAPEITTPAVVSGDLKIINLRYTQSKDGPIRPESPYRPGDKVYVSYDVIGYTTDQEGKVNLFFTVAPLDPNGLPLYPPYKHELRETVPKAGEPINGYFNFDLPLYAPSGKFIIHIKVHDAVKSVDSELKQSFTVDAPSIAEPKGLEFRDFYFSLSEGGPPITQPVIQPGGTIHSSCKVLGLQFREDRPDVNISLKVIGPNGEIVIDKPTLVSINEQYFYRPAKFFRTISAWVTLPSKAPAGRYTWKYMMTDRIANAKVDYEASFEVK